MIGGAETMTGACSIGTCGWSYRHWRERFYPKGLRQADWFAHYARHFQTVEINASFYRVPKETTFERWRTLAPPGFVFALKANRMLTHIKRLKDCGDVLEAFLARARLLGDRLGPVLYQLPPSWEPDPETLAGFAALLPADLVHVFEFRHSRCHSDALRRVLADHDLVFCIHDMAGCESPRWITGPVVYLRLHGGRGGHTSAYGETALGAWAAFLRREAARGRDAFVYFNNDVDAHAVTDAKTLRRLVEGG